MCQTDVRSLRVPRSRGLACCRTLFDDRGSAVVELALALSFFVLPLLLGTAEMGILLYDSIEISNAAHAGAIYGMVSLANASDTAGIKSAAQAEASDFYPTNLSSTTTLTVTSTPYYACSAAVTGTQYPGTAAGQASATAACTGGGNHPLEFILVKTSAPVTPPIHCPGLPATFTPTGSSVMEVQN